MTGGNGGLPDGWVTTTLGDARLDLSKSIDPRKSGSEMFELYSVPSFSDRRPEIVSGDTVGSSKRTVEPNSVLLCKINPRINRVWVVRDYSRHRKIASTEWLCFSELSGLFPDFLCYCLQQDSFRDYLATNASGVGGSLMRVKDTTFADHPFPLAPLSEQRRIVAEIEKQFTRLDASVAALKRVQANLKRYRASVLKAACEGKLVPTEAELAPADGRDYEPADRLLERILAERRARWESQEKRRGKYKEPVSPDTSKLPELAEGWVWATADQLSMIVSGQTPRGIIEIARSSPCGTPWYRVSDMNAPGNDVNMVAPSSLIPAPDLARLRLHVRPPGTIIFPKRGGAIATNKKRRLSVSAAYDLNTMGMIPADGLGDYLWWWFQTIDLSALGDGSNVPQINHDDIQPVVVSLPPLAEQHRIVAEVERRLSVAQQAEAAVDANLARAERLRQSILKQAFSGKLVPQDPDDEPASALLERIRAEREAAQAAAKSNRKPKRRRARKSRQPQPAHSEGDS